jgi:hypothetical protein
VCSHFTIDSHKHNTFTHTIRRHPPFKRIHPPIHPHSLLNSLLKRLSKGGGELWAHDLGACDIRHKFLKFDGNIPHCTVPWTSGPRYTLVRGGGIWLTRLCRVYFVFQTQICARLHLSPAWLLQSPHWPTLTKTNQSINQPINQPINQSINQPINPSII